MSVQHRAGPLLRHITVFAMALAVPGMLCFTLVIQRWAAAEQDRFETAIVELATRATDEIERLLASHRAMLQALATSPALDDGDFDRFDRQAREVPLTDGVVIVLKDITGQQRVNTRLPPGSPLPVRFLASDSIVLATNRTYISDVLSIAAAPGRFVVISIPVVRNGEVLYLLNASIPPAVFETLIDRTGIRTPYAGSVVDRTGTIIAHSARGGTKPGDALPAFSEYGGASGIWMGPNAEGVPVRNAYRRLSETGWLVNVGIPQHALTAPLRGSLILLAGLSALLFLAAIVVSVPVLRRLLAAQRIAAVASQSQVEAEIRAQTLIEALPQMVFIFSDPNSRLSSANVKFRTYFGLSELPSERPGGIIHPEDSDRADHALSCATETRRGYEIELRLRRHDGCYRWHKVVMTPIWGVAAGVEWLGTALDIDEMVSARKAMEAATELLGLAQESAGAGVWDWDLGSGLIRLSPASLRLHDATAPARAMVDGLVDLTLEEWESHIHTDDLPAVWAEWARAVKERTTYASTYRIASSEPDGRVRWLQTYGRVVFDPITDEPIRCVGLDFDATARHEAEEALRLSEARLRTSQERLALALDSGDDGLWDWNIASGEAWVSDRWRQMLGYGTGVIMNDVRSWEFLIHPDDASHAVALLQQHLKGLTPQFECEYRMVRKDGSLLWVLTRGRVVQRGEDGRAQRIVGTQIDISRRKEAEQQIGRMALHDALTGLPNRVLFRERLHQTIAHAETEGGSFAVLCLDLDRFKAVNDTYGHPAGDDLLRITAERLSAALPEDATIARLGGDEFVIILNGHGDAVDATAAHRIIEAIGQPFDLDGRLAHIGVSIGISVGPEVGADADTLFKRADIALYRAKAAGRNTHCLYEAGMDNEVAIRNLMALEMREAIRRKEFVLYYQPVMSLADDTICGFEALMRWSHPTRGLIPPATFIPLAEETGFILALGEWALQDACREAASWAESQRVAVNVSARQFQQPGLEQIVADALAASGLPAHRLEIEITESVLMQDSEAVIACLHRLRALGVRIALDDFGTGYSSLSYLRRFPFDTIKVDRSFVHAIDEPDTAAIVQAIVGLGVRLGAGVTAEGIETEAQLARMRQKGCGEAQGYLFSKPLPAEQLGGLVVRNTRAAQAA